MSQRIKLFLKAAVVVMMIGLWCPLFAAGPTDHEKNLTLSQVIDKIELFKNLTASERNALKTVVTLRSGKSGEHIIEQGKSLSSMYIILNGKIDIIVNGKLLCTYSGQSLVGEMEFLDGLPASASVVLVDPSDMVVLNNRALTRLMKKQPELGYVLMREIARIEAGRLRKE